MSEWRAGFAKPWITWDGVESNTGKGRVTVDGRPIPVLIVRCDCAHDHLPGHDHCRPVPTIGPFAGEQGEPPGFSAWMPLENRMWAAVLVDDHSSWVVLDTDPLHERCRAQIVNDVIVLCPNTYKDECGNPGHRSWDIGGRDVWVEFENYEELMGRVDYWGRLEVRNRPVRKRRRPQPEKARRGDRRQGVGTVTREEYLAGTRPGWWAD